MPIRRGMVVVRQIKEAQKSRGGGGNANFFMLSDGESATCRLYGDFENNLDPVNVVTHNIFRLARADRSQNCNDNLPDGHELCGKCVYCHMAKNGDKGIKKQERAIFWLRDMRRIHKMEQEVRILKPGVRPPMPGQVLSPENYTLTKYPPCSAPRRVCSLCGQGNQARENGYRYWNLANQYAEQVAALQADVREYCRCGSVDENHGGTIRVNQYLCGNSECMQPVHHDPNEGRPVAHCGHCNNMLPPFEQISCDYCETPTRSDLQDWIIKVTRTGAEQDTSYNFEKLKFDPPSDEEINEAYAKRPNFDEMFQPEPPELQAMHLGCPSPFHTVGHGAQPYANAGPQAHGIRPNNPANNAQRIVQQPRPAGLPTPARLPPPVPAPVPRPAATAKPQVLAKPMQTQHPPVRPIPAVAKFGVMPTSTMQEAVNAAFKPEQSAIVQNTAPRLLARPAVQQALQLKAPVRLATKSPPITEAAEYAEHYGDPNEQYVDYQ